jgi:hypothetical protein
VIPYTLLTFRDTQLSLFLNIDGANIIELKLLNGYFDSIAEFLMMINALPGLTAIGLSFSFSMLTESLKLTKTINTDVPFSVKAFYFQSNNNVCKRLGFTNPNSDYRSFLEGSNQVIYASSTVRLLRTSGFYVICNGLCTIETASPNGNLNVIDFIPIQHDLAYGDVISVSNASISKDIPSVSNDQVSRPHNSQFSFQLLDDEMQAINDRNQYGNTILFINFDYA